MPNVVITGAARTAMGGFQGVFADVDAPTLGGAAIRAALDQAGQPEVDELLMGCVLPAGQGQAPARQAGFGAGLDQSVPATTLNKMCGSGMKTAMMAFDQIAAGGAQTVVAGGMESMTNAPYLMPKMRGGGRIGHQQVVDSMFLDGLEDAYDKGRLMGAFAEDCAEKFQFTRADQDEYALRSLSNALDAQGAGAFAAEITPVSLTTRKGEVVISHDEQPANARPDKIPLLKPAFRKDGSVTAANASSISDGAAALVLSNEDTATGPIRARILGHASHAQEPGWFATAPVPATQKLLDRVERRRCRPMGGERSLRGGAPGLYARTGHSARPDQRQRWRLCVGPPHWGFWHPHHCYAFERFGKTRAQTRCCCDLHRGW